MRTEYTREIAQIAGSHGLSPDLVEAQVIVESFGRADAFRYEAGILAQIQAGKLKPKYLPANQSPRRIASSYGLMQVLWITAGDHGFTGEPELLFIPWVNLEWGCTILGELLDWTHGDYTKAFCAYNGGKGAVASMPYRNQGYADRVQRSLEEMVKT